MKVEDIRKYFIDQLQNGNFVIDKSGVKLVEMVGASFIADEETIFGPVNYDYVRREIDWYESTSLYVNHIPGKTPAIWEQIADDTGRINSNYGWCIWSHANGNQFRKCLQTLLDHRESRRAIMIYTRPSMQVDYCENGMSDFMCTNAVQYVIRNGKLDVIVQMRSNDAWAGYRNDYAWAKHVQYQLLKAYNVNVDMCDKVEMGNIHWQVGSLHLYQRQFYLIDAFIKGVPAITKKDYGIKFPNSEWV